MVPPFEGDAGADATLDTDVLVVGAGPTGLMLAHELACRGVRVRIIDKNPDRASESRALVVHARSLELLDRHGLAEPMVAQGRRALDVTGHVEGKSDFKLALGDIGVEDTRFPFLLFLSQAETEACLAEALARRGIEIERQTSLVDFVERDPIQSSKGVVATVARDERKRSISARFLVGCDGAHSTVRHQLNLTFEGAPYAQEFFLADVYVTTSLPTDELHFFLTTRGLLAMFPFRESNFVRVLGSRVDAPSPSDGRTQPLPPPTREDVQSFVDTLATAPIRIESMRWSAHYRLHHRAVDTFRVGSVFVAGDAGHIHSPAGGQGMNTGLQDAANLGWKIADVLAGRAGDSLLASYQAERAPVAKKLLRITDRLFSAATVQNPVLLRLRNALVPRIVPRVVSTPERRRSAFRMVSQLAVGYRRSPIVSRVGEPVVPGPLPGQRLPDAPLVRNGETVWLSQATRGLDHFVLRFESGEATRAPEVASPDNDNAPALPALPIVCISRNPRDGALHDASGAAFRRFAVEHSRTYVVRPDRYIAIVSPNDDVGEAVELSRKLTAL